MKIEGNRITAEDGKVLIRKSDGRYYGKCTSLGLTFAIGGVLLDTPKYEYPEDFGEDDEGNYPEYMEYKNNNIE